jgi:hypothetical protein
MLRDYLRRILSASLFDDASLQNRVMIIVAGFCMFLFPSMVGMNLSYLGIYLNRQQWSGLRDLLSSSSMLALLNDVMVREVVLGLIFSIGLILILVASHGEPRCDFALVGVGFLLILESVLITAMLTQRCTVSASDRDCSSSFFMATLLQSVAYVLSGVMIPRAGRQQVAWFAAPYGILLVGLCFKWLMDLARVPMIEVNWVVFRAVLLLFYVMGTAAFIAVVGNPPPSPGQPASPRPVEWFSRRRS